MKLKEINISNDIVTANTLSDDLSSYYEKVDGISFSETDDGIHEEIYNTNKEATLGIIGKSSTLDMQSMTGVPLLWLAGKPENLSSTTKETAYAITTTPQRIETKSVRTDGSLHESYAKLPFSDGTIVLNTTLSNCASQELADALWPFLSSKVFPENS